MTKTQPDATNDFQPPSLPRTEPDRGGGEKTRPGWNDVETLEIDPDLEPIRTDPEFKAVVQEFRKPAG